MYERVDVAPLIRAHRDGTAEDWRHLAEAVTAVENAFPWSVSIPKAPHPVQLIGITGPPGVGKSTLVGKLIENYVQNQLRVGTILVDPSSLKSGGAVLGDRVRMLGVHEQEGVFTRSIATRGANGAIATATSNIAAVLASTGSFDVILIETVGAGQSEIAISEVVDTMMLVTTPNLGDSIQAIKSGIMEYADIAVMNMADQPGVNMSVRQLRSAVGRHMPIVRTVATEGKGLLELRDKLDQHWSDLEATSPGYQVANRSGTSTMGSAALRMTEEWLRWCLREGSLSPYPSTERAEDAVPTVLTQALQRWKETF